MERTWRNFRRRRCCALCPVYGFVAPVSAAPPGGDIPHTAKNPAPFGTGFFLNAKTKSPVFRPGFLLYLMPGSSLLSHGETPHYHRRYGVSLLSSAWGQVGPPRYRRQANSLCSSCVFCAHTALAALANVSHILMYAPSIASFAALSQRKILRTLNQS